MEALWYTNPFQFTILVLCSCEIWGCHSSVAEDSSHLVYDIVPLGLWAGIAQSV
jgi:hypothetical protein